MIFEGRKGSDGTWTVVGTISIDDHNKMLAEFAMLAAVCEENPDVWNAMKKAFRDVAAQSQEPQEGGVA